MIFGEEYTLLEPQVKGLFEERVESLAAQLTQLDAAQEKKGRYRTFARAFMSDVSNQWQSLQSSRLGMALASAPFSFIEQPPLSGSKIALLVGFAQGVEVRHTAPTLWSVERDGVKEIFQREHAARDAANPLSSEQQTEAAFHSHMQLLEEHGMDLPSHCLRTWLYVRDIDRHYAGVVRGRNNVFSQVGLTKDTHFIASTGIGGEGGRDAGEVCVDFLSVNCLPRLDVRYLHAPEWLNPTHEYGVAFERGTAVTVQGVKTLLISGTASIDKHGACLYRGDVERQCGRLFQNIGQLLSDGGAALSDLRHMIVYLRDVCDYPLISSMLKERFPLVPCVITSARVCRPEWLMEVECVASRQVEADTFETIA